MREWKTTEAYIKRIIEADGVTIDHLVGLRRDVGAESAGASGLTDAALDSFDRFANGKQLDDDDKFRMEAIVVPNGLRPVFDVKQDSFKELPSPWQSINPHRLFVEDCIRAVGRIDVPGHPRLRFAGTAFVVAPNLLLTNRHVAQEFCAGIGTSLSFTPGITPDVDFKQEVASLDTLTLKVTKPVVILSDWDAAIFEVEPLPSSIKPLALAGSQPGTIEQRLATIIGFPALDATVSTQEILQQLQIFGAVFDRKRLQPGRLIGFRSVKSFGRDVSSLGHDCSTLGGNSGSALLDIERELITGLHFGGEFLVANFSVPTWELAKEPELTKLGLNFV